MAEREEKNQITRRSFLTGAGLVVAGAAVGAGVGIPLASGGGKQTGQSIKWDEEADVVVCGSGAGGLPAAIEAADAGNNVLILEKLDYIGGSMRRCGGGIFGGPTKISKALGVEDSPDSVYEFFTACGEGVIDPDLTRTIADNIGPSIDWFVEKLGAPIPSSWAPTFLGGLVPAGAVHNSYSVVGIKETPRMYILAGMQTSKPFKGGGAGGALIFAVFEKALNDRKKNIQVKMQTALTELVVNSSKEVLGVKAVSAGKTLFIKANKAVVLATGGWINNDKLMHTFDPRSRWYRIDAVEKVKPSDESCIGWPLYLALPELSGGEGTIAGMAIGADLINMSVIAENIDTNGGLRVNTKTQVIDTFGNPIPRLYACGYTSGGWMGYLDPSGGTRIGTCMTLGRISGQQAATLAPQGDVTFPTPAPVQPVAAPTDAGPRVFVYTVALPFAETDGYAVNGYIPWAKGISDATKGTLELKLNYSESLVPAAQTYEAVKVDDVDLGHLKTELYPDRFLIEGMVGLPGLGIASSVQATKILNQLWEKYALQFTAEYEIVHLMTLFSTSPNVLITKKPVATVGDITGLKIMVETATLADAMTALGATPVVLQPSAVAAALDSGEIDGALLDWPDVAANSLFDKVDNFMEIGLSVKPCGTISNNPRWIALPLETQDSMKPYIGLDGGLMMAEKGFDATADAIRTQVKGMSGKTISNLQPEDVVKISTATEDIRKKYVNSVTEKKLPGQEIYDEIISLISSTK
jgi:TRAP-type C4-dicarboxylate transport system substrate-binding protein